MKVVGINPHPVENLRTYHAQACGCGGAIETCEPAIAQLTRLGMVPTARAS